MQCYLCNCKTFVERKGVVRDKSNLKVVQCENCGLVTLNDFSHISTNHYELGKMHNNQNTISEWVKETEIDDNRRVEMLKSKMIGKNLLDFGCGNGNFLLKSLKFTGLSQGVELEERVQKHFQHTDLIIWNSIEDLIINGKDKFDIITSFHVFEHLEDPIKMLLSLVKMLNSNGEIIIEVPSSDDALLTLFNCDEFANFTYWSQHLYLFNQHTFTELIKKSGLKLNWVKQIQRYGLANHLYWLSNKLPGGQNKWNFLNSKILDEIYGQQLASVGKCDTILASVSIS